MLATGSETGMIVALAALAVGGGCAFASQWPTSQLFGAALIAGRDPNQIALTFDDGPNPAVTPSLLELLAQHNVRATFFLIGAFARSEPALVRELAAAGHLIGNHTMSHPRLSILPAGRIHQELTGCSALLEDIIGAPVRFFRPPFGARRPHVLRAAKELGLTPVLWNVTAHDWNPIGADAILRNLEQGIAHCRRVHRSANLLLHDGGHRVLGAARQDTVTAVARLLEAHRNTSSRFVTVDAWA